MPSALASRSTGPVRVAIVGAGPAGFYTAAALLAAKPEEIGGELRIDLFDRLPTPYGLVRFGVAPDHPKIKEVVRVFERTALDPRVRFYGGIDLGNDVTVAELRERYDQIVVAVGGSSDRRLGVPGEDLAGSHSSTALVAWYSAHPDFVDLAVDLDTEAAAVIGAGNVAVDVVRVLARQPDELATTDICDCALGVIRASRLRDIYFLVRRGPVQAKWSLSELKELSQVGGVDLLVDPRDLELDPGSEAELAADPQAQKGVEFLRQIAARGATGAARRVHLKFLASPVEILGRDGRVDGLVYERNRLEGEPGQIVARGTGETHTLPVGLVVRAVGYRSLPVAGLPFDPKSSTIPHVQGRVVDPATGERLAGVYVAGWIKRGPTGLIGSNKPDGVETAAAMLADLGERVASRETPPPGIDALLAERALEPVDFAGWKRIDEIEVARGRSKGKPRSKFGRRDDMRAALAGAAVSALEPGA